MKKIQVLCQVYSSTGNGIKTRVTTYMVSPSTSMRALAVRALCAAQQADPDFRCPQAESENDFSIEINLNGHTKQSQLMGIKYKLSQDGSILFLDNYKQLTSDWTYGELVNLRRNEYIDGDVNCIVFRIPEGLGSFGGDLRKLFDVLTIVNLIFSNLGYGFTCEEIKTQSEPNVVQNWLQSNLYRLSQIRGFLDEKATWNTQEVMTRLRLNEEETIQLMTELGYCLERNSWKLATTQEAAEKRKVWLQHEQEEETRLTKEVEASIYGALKGTD